MFEPIEIAPKPPKPNLPGTVVVRESVDDVIDAMLADLMMHASGCVRAFGDFHLALSGGSTPEPLYRRLMYDVATREFPWKRTHLWIVDERRVPFEDDRSNFKMIRELIVGHSDIPRDQVHPIEAMEPDADVRYERALRDTLEWREKGHDRLDYVLLGMGSDAHTASLFPKSPALDVSGKLVAINAGPMVTPPERVTLTYEMLNASRFVSVMVTGSRKRATVAKVAGRKGSSHELPILGVKPLAGEMRWYLDAEACPTPESDAGRGVAGA